MDFICVDLYLYIYIFIYICGLYFPIMVFFIEIAKVKKCERDKSNNLVVVQHVHHQDLISNMH